MTTSGRPHHRVFGRGWQFDPRHSSNSTRTPLLFEWTDDPDLATVDVVVDFDGALGRPLESPAHRRIAWMIESPATTRWQRIAARLDTDLDRIMEDYEVLLTCDRALAARHARVRWHPAGSNLPWIPEPHHGLYAKDRMVSMIAGSKRMVEGHRIRLEHAGRWRHLVDLWGGAFGSPALGDTKMHGDKRDALCRYRFHICMENTRHDLYYSEKITDCFATGTVPVYWGSNRIGELFDPAGIITLDDTFDPRDLSVELYRSMLPAVRRNLGIVRRLWGADDLLWSRYLAPDRDDGAGVFRSHDGGGRAVVVAARVAVRRRSHADLVVAANAPKVHVDDIASLPRDRVTTWELPTTTTDPIHLDRGDRPWFEPLHQAVLLHVPDAFIGDNVVFDDHRWYGLGNWWAGSHGDLAAVRDVRHVDAGVLVSGWGGDAFQHFVIDALPRLAAVLEMLESPAGVDVAIVSHLAEAPAAQWFWRRLGLVDRVVQKPRNPSAGFVVHADVAMVVEFQPTVSELGYLPRGVLRPVQERLGVLDGPADETLLYLWREGRRSVADQDRLVSVLDAEARRAGLTLDVRRDGSPDEDLPRMRRARLVVGPHGGAFANLAFARPGTDVIEFLPVDEPVRTGAEVRSMYWGLAQAAGLTYRVVEPATFGFDDPQMVLDVDTVVETVRGALG